MSGPDNATVFYDEFASKLLCDFVSGNPRTESAIRFACDQLQRRKPGNILDLGCGLGWSSYEYSRCLPNSMILGVDLSPELTMLASQMFGSETGTKYICQDLSEDVWNDRFRGSYGACVMLDVYEHIPRSSRDAFVRGLGRILADDALLILTCPTPMHQEYLRSFNPEGIQPIDEDIRLSDLLFLAGQLNGELVHLEHKSIWAENDYFHAVISRSNQRSELRSYSAHKLIHTAERYRRLEYALPIVSKETIDQIRKSRRSLKRGILKRLKLGR
ncbi:MAG: class I SAM-dependent methyltransferase [Verrucomicrobiales bacterium]|nr:class I SAM-dependent methyltransferase [Verrucomicrobiales bacterium]